MVNKPLDDVKRPYVVPRFENTESKGRNLTPSYDQRRDSKRDMGPVYGVEDRRLKLWDGVPRMLSWIKNN